MSKKFLAYLTTVLSGFSAISALASLSQVSRSWLVVSTALSALLLSGATVYYFRSLRNAAFVEWGEVLGPYRTKRADLSDLKAVAEIDQQVYGPESVDYAGLLSWGQRYGGVTLLLKESDIIGAVGIWPLTKLAFDGLAAGQLEEGDLDGACICNDRDAEPRAHWYFGDIILLKQFRHGKVRGLSVFLLEEAVREWVRNGNLAERLSLCALAFKEKAELKRDSIGEGEKFLQNFRFERTASSPSGHPVYVRRLTKSELQEVVAEKITRPAEYMRERRKRESLAKTMPARRWQWMPVTAAAALLVTVVVFRQLPSYTSSASTTPLYVDAPKELARQTAEVLKVGLRDHTHCALDVWEEKTESEELMAEALGRDYAPLIGVVRASLAGAYEVASAHRCNANGREFTHIILRGQGALVSVAITPKGGESFPQQGSATERVVSGIALYRANLKALEVAGFDVQDYRVFVVSNLGREENLGVAAKLAAPVQKFLLKL